MFKICLITDDRKLPKLLRALDGLIVGPPEVSLLKGAEEVDGEVREAEVPATPFNRGKAPSPLLGRARKAPGATVPDKVVAVLLKQKPPVITAKVLSEATESVGSKGNSYWYVVTSLRKWGILTGPTAAGIFNLNEAAYHRRMASGES